MTFGREITLEEARALPVEWRWSGHGDFCPYSLEEALGHSPPGNILQAWRPQEKPTAAAIRLDLEDSIREWCGDDSHWYALSTFSEGIPDGCALLDSPTFGPALEDLLRAELAKVKIQAHEEAEVWIRVPADVTVSRFDRRPAVVLTAADLDAGEGRP